MSEFAKPHPHVTDFLLTRRSHLAITLSEPGPDAETLEKILTIGARVPDHGKLAPWRFVVYAGEARSRIGEHLAALAESRNGPLSEAQRTQELNRFIRSAVVIGVLSRAAVHPKIPVWEQELSAGAACMNILTAATAAGFGAQWISEWYSFDDEAARYLGAAEGERFAGFIHIGTPAQAPFERPRPELASIVTHWAGE
ncbi:nitroreductase family protein [Pannonibacter phragmitetus]|uniref:Putative NAD(P)H nitroreductase n=1 Tax=Pannonibacter phragmitetus TaxID=121719 RepID=A0A0U3ECW3_9HYPH|nr:nitroreductase [Pannonibacter phragmitetus]ALV29361.1 nitroreductase [Pannonibacter phragmitetus]